MKFYQTITIHAIILFSFLICFNSNAQEWKWGVNGYGTSHRTEVLATDKYNNSYVAVYYTDSISMGTQSYYHYQWPDQYNCLLLKLDSHGNLLNQIDLYCPPVMMGSVRPLKMSADTAGNVYLAGAFAVRIFIGDTVINHLLVPAYEGPEAYLVKFDRNFDMKWAKVIGCPHYMYFQNMTIRNNHIYYSVNPHAWSSSNPVTLYCFGQDTLYFPQINASYSVFFNLDLDGQIESYEVLKGNNFWIEREIIAENNDRYLIGIVLDTVFANNKPIYIPEQVNESEQYILHYNSVDSLVGTSKVVTSNKSYVNITKGGTGDELYFYMAAYAGLTIANEPIIFNYANTWVIGKLDSQRNLSWYETLAGLDNPPGFSDANMDLMNDTLYVAADFGYYLILSDTAFYQNNGTYDNIIISYTSQGNRTGYLKTNTSDDSHTSGIAFDNCENIILSGSFQGSAYYGSDTLQSHYPVGNSTSDFFVAYYDRGVKALELGPDITVCGSIMLKGPAGWNYYNWNNGISTNRDFEVIKSGIYSLTVWNVECCVLEDSISVVVLLKPEISLGTDTILKQSQTLTLEAPTGFKSYLWSTGDTTFQVELIGSEFTTGFHSIWCEVSDNSCSGADSLTIEVINDIGITEYPDIAIEIYPNPFSGSFRLSAEKPVESVELLDYTGKSIAIYTYNQVTQEPVDISFTGKSTGILLLKIRAENRNYFRKVISATTHD